MRKIGLIAVVAAVILVGVGAWMEWVTLDFRPAPPLRCWSWSIHHK